MSTLTDNSDIESARQVIVRAIEKCNADRAALLASDGKTPIDPPATYQAKVAKALEIVTFATDKAVALADSIAVETEKARLAPHSDPTLALSASDLADANLRSRWVAEDCSELPLVELSERLRAVHASGNKASTWLHDRYAKRRWQKESAKTPQPLDLVVLGETLRGLNIVGDRAGLSDEQQKRLDKAQSLKMFAGSQLRIAANPEQDARDKAAFRQAIRL